MPLSGNNKLDTLLSPDEEISSKDVRLIIDFQQIQELMNSFFKVTKIGIGLIDLKGNILVATGWQDICSKFHRMHPQTLANCIESDIYLAQGLEGENCKIYKCKNNMWDIATPINVAGKHMANLFLGQFFFEDEVFDREIFTRQAEEFGFDKEDYLAALERIPRWSRETVRNVLEFYSHFARMIAELGYRNIRLAKALVERKRSEEALKVSEAEKSLILNSTSDLIAYHDREMKVVWGNGRALDSVGMQLEEMVGRPCWEIWHQRSEACEGCPVVLALDTGKPQEGEIRSPDGREWYIRGFPVKDDDGSVKGVVEFSLEITKRKRAEYALLESERLLESEKRSRLLFEHMLEGVAYCRMLYDDNGCPQDFVYLDVNSSYLKLIGLHDVIGKRVTELLPGIKKSTPELFDLYGRVAATGRPEKCEIYVKQLSLWRSMSVYSPGKGYFVAISENITERKRIETDLQESHHNLRKLTAHLNLTREMELKAFARKVHDELGTSLTLLKFDLAWLKRNYPTADKSVTERIRAMDELIHESTKTVQLITSELRPSLLDEQGLAATIEWQAREFEKRSGISFNLEIDPFIPSLSQDKTINVFRIFQQALSNVMRHADATSVLVSLSKAARQLVLQITDNGMGISDQALSAATSFGIMGMKERTRLCGGNITIVGTQGMGTTISVAIPIDEKGDEQCSAY